MNIRMEITSSFPLYTFHLVWRSLHSSSSPSFPSNVPFIPYFSNFTAPFPLNVPFLSLPLLISPAPSSPPTVSSVPSFLIKPPFTPLTNYTQPTAATPVLLSSLHVMVLFVHARRIRFSHKVRKESNEIIDLKGREGMYDFIGRISRKKCSLPAVFVHGITVLKNMIRARVRVTTLIFPFLSTEGLSFFSREFMYH